MLSGPAMQLHCGFAHLPFLSSAIGLSPSLNVFIHTLSTICANGSIPSLRRRTPAPPEERSIEVPCRTSLNSYSLLGFACLPTMAHTFGHNCSLQFTERTYRVGPAGTEESEALLKGEHIA